jgi:hypothetical protein
MERKPGCLKYTMFGCLGLIAVVVLVVGISAIVAWVQLDKGEVADRELTPAVATAERDLAVAGPVGRAVRPGRLILDFAHGGFTLEPAKPGQPLHVEARYDTEAFQLEEASETLADSSWVYRLSFRRKIPWLQLVFRRLMGGGHDPEIDVFVPPDYPLALEVAVEEGGFEAELGGLWITEADLHYAKGGFELKVSEPLREPMERLVIHGRMGGIDAAGLGNASPRTLTVGCTMGGADLDLRGAWVRDCDIGLAVTMGGVSVEVPRDVIVAGIEESGLSRRREEGEASLPVLRFATAAKMGEIEIR